MGCTSRSYSPTMIRICVILAASAVAAVVIDLAAVYLWVSFQDGHEFPY